MATYYVRADGSAANKAAATDPTSASTSMSGATANAETFSAGDHVVYSSRGGTLTAKIIPPSAGSAGTPIVYEGETGYEPTLNPADDTNGAILVQVSHVTLSNLTVVGNTYGLHFNGGTLTGVTTNNLTITSPTGEGVRHESATTVTHNNLTVSGIVEPLTSHAACNITINGGSISDYSSSGALRIVTAAPTWTINDVTFTAADGGQLLGATVANAVYSFSRCYIKDLGTARTNDFRALSGQTVYFYNCLFRGLTITGDYYLLIPATARVVNCVFDGNGRAGPATQVIYNAAAGCLIENNIFYHTGGKNCASTNGVDYCCFHDAGTAKGANSITDDPLFTDAANEDYTIAVATSPCAGVGNDESAYFTDDYAGTTRVTWDMGAYVAAAASGTFDVSLSLIEPHGGGGLIL